MARKTLATAVIGAAALTAAACSSAPPPRPEANLTCTQGLNAAGHRTLTVWAANARPTGTYIGDVYVDDGQVGGKPQAVTVHVNQRAGSSGTTPVTIPEPEPPGWKPDSPCQVLGFTGK